MVSMTGLWSYDNITGYWRLERIVGTDTAENWLRIFQNDEPDVVFKLSKNRPVKAPEWEKT